MAAETSKLLLYTFLLFLPQTFAYLEGLYCGLENCYDILGVDRESTKGEITKSYRKLARIWHPDMHRTEAKKEEASAEFQKIANAYEILKDEEQRSDYDYMLDHPDEHMMNYYHYYRRRYAPKVDPRIVIAVTITVVSFIQYYGAWSNYNSAISYLCKEPKYRFRAMEIARSEGLLNTNKKKDKRSKEEIREEEEQIIKTVIEEKMDIKGGYSKPSFYDVLWVQLVMLPYYTVHYIFWYCKWIWRFHIMRQEYDEEAKLYIIRKNMKMKEGQFNGLEDYEIEDYLKKELWIKENFADWKQKKEDEMKIKMAENARYKSYRRYMKKGGPGQMTFGPE